LSALNTPKVNIVTLEDPIEYKIAGVNQVQINPGAGLTFASGLRSFLRQDPNVILVGEIRDQETADLAVQAALTVIWFHSHTTDASGLSRMPMVQNLSPHLKGLRRIDQSAYRIYS
jgi:type IV pilus assembly protein PilB